MNYFHFTKDLVHAQHQSVYVPNYHRALDYSNFDELPLSVQQQEDDEIQLNEALDLLQPITLPLQTSTDAQTSDVSTEKTKLLQNTTVLPSAESADQKSTPPSKKNSEENSTQTPSKLTVDWSNKTHVLRKNLRNSDPREQAARYLANQKFLQSLMHLIPPNLWAQINNNRSMMQKNQTQYSKPLLPNPVVLAEAAAQAGLPGPGPYPIPDHLWHRNPPQMITRPRTTSKFIAIKETSSFETISI